MLLNATPNANSYNDYEEHMGVDHHRSDYATV